MAAGSVSLLGALGLYVSGRMSGDARRQIDGIFIGLWAPSFYILADRLATAALDHQSKRRSVAAGTELTEDPLEIEANESCGPIQSPRPLAHTLHSEGFSG